MLVAPMTDFAAIRQQIRRFFFIVQKLIFRYCIGCAKPVTDDRCHVHTTCVANKMPIQFRTLTMCGIKGALMWPAHTRLNWNMRSHSMHNTLMMAVTIQNFRFDALITFRHRQSISVSYRRLSGRRVHVQFHVHNHNRSIENLTRLRYIALIIISLEIEMFHWFCGIDDDDNGANVYQEIENFLFAPEPR